MSDRQDHKPHDKTLLHEVVDTVDSGVRFAVGTVGKVGKVLTTPISLAGSLLPKPGYKRRRPGAPPGIEQIENVHTPPDPGQVVITCYDYGPARVENAQVRVADLDAFWQTGRPDWATVRWINIDGLNPYVVREFKEQYNLHTLAAEDVLHGPQRPKVDAYDDNLFTVARMIMARDGQLYTEQTSFFLLDGTLLTFQETPGDVWDAVRERLAMENLKIRKAGADYLLYALLDAMVDHAFPMLERYSERLEALEDSVIADPRPAVLREVHRVKQDLSILRRVVWPMREVLDTLYRNEHGRLALDTRPFVRDVYDHSVQVLDIVETYREMASGLGDLYMNAMSQRMNDVMKVLTIIATLFIPISFVAGVWGMNVPVPGEHSSHGFWWIVGGCAAISGGLLVYFRRKRWI